MRRLNGIYNRKKSIKSSYVNNGKIKTKAKFAGVSLSVLALTACGGGGGGGGNAAPTTPTPAPPAPPTPPPVPTTSVFTLTAADTYVASNNLPGTFNQSSSTADLTVTGRNGNDSITTGSGADIIVGAGGNDVINAGDGNDGVAGGDGADVMDGGAGIGDLLVYLNSPSAVNVNLATGAASGGAATGDSFINFEDLLGSQFNDTLTGDANSNILEGVGGADALDGGANTDYASYLRSTSGVNVNLLTGNGTGGDAQGDTYTSIEGAFGSAFDDTITGDGNANFFLSFDGDDTLDGGAGNDFFNGGLDDDTINGDAGDDFIIGGEGADTIDGGADIDTVSYTASTVGVNVNLATGTGTGGDAAGDLISNVENVYGSEEIDTITGDANDNLIDGFGGVDTLNGGGGDDTFLSYEFDSSHEDSFDGEAGDDTLALISLSLVTAYDNDLSTMNVTNIENIDLGYLDAVASVESLTLTAQDVLDVTDVNDQLVILGGAEDSVTSTGQGWVQGADQIIDAETYHTYTSGTSTLLIDEDITQTIT